MYIVVLNEGYLQIEGDEFHGYHIVDYPGGEDHKLKVNGKMKTVKIAPIGQIVVDIYNDWLEYDLSHGGTVEESLQHHAELFQIQEDRNNFLLPLDARNKTPKFEIWENKSAEDLADVNAVIFNYLDFVPTSYINISGQILPVFIVDDIHDLEEYDRRHLYKNKKAKSVRLCADCGKAFLGKKTAKRCPECREEGNKRQIRENRKKFARDNVYRITDTASKRLLLKRFAGNEGIDYEKNYIEELRKYIKCKKKGLSSDDLDSFAKNLKSIDQKFYSLFTFIEDLKDSNLKKQWRGDRYKIWDQEDPEQWLKDWYIKAGKPWP